MSAVTPVLPKKPTIVYPVSDGQPMSDNTEQFRWITTIQGGLDAVFREDPNVFVAGNLLWYPIEGDINIREAPDVLVVFGRPKQVRGSYLQWLESNIAPQVVFEVVSPGNRAGMLTNKFKFYETHGVEEYFLYDPENCELSGWRREGDDLCAIKPMSGWVSPRLKVRFDMVNDELCLVGPDGKKFATYVELVEQREQAQKRAERLAAQLRSLGIEPEV